MTPLVSLHSLSKAYGAQQLFTDISFTISLKDRVGLIGPNGSGKSTLLKIVMGKESADNGSIAFKQGVVIGYASQAPEFPSLSIEDVLIQAAPQASVEEKRTTARILLSKAQFTDFEQNATLLSGGWKKRLDIARALMQKPDLLLLDEPTNHLDLEGILWLEKFLMREKTPYMVVSHDRMFLEHVTNKIIELNTCYPQGLFISAGTLGTSLSTYLEHRDAFLMGQAEQQRSVASSLRDEVEWLRRSPKARTTKQQARVRRAHEMMQELADLKKANKIEKVSLEFNASERETRKLLVAKNISKLLSNKLLFSGIDITLSPGTRLGLVGKNGTGKTTLLKVLAGHIPQDMGTIKVADDLKLVYFDQHREHLPEAITLKEALCESGEHVNYRGQNIHVAGFAKRFLFPKDRLQMPISCLSGGERARILIAKLMLQPADILFLDEPTNDLDIQTLEVMEESLIDFPGAVVLISHDRSLMQTLCTHVLGLGENEPTLFSGYNQWEESQTLKIPKKEVIEKVKPLESKKSTKLSYKEQQELKGMEQAIIEVEREIYQLKTRLDVSQAQQVVEIYRLLAEAEGKLETLFARWQTLEDK